MYHAWITHWTVDRATLTMPRCHKARLVAGGHQTSDPIWSSFNNIPKTINIPSQIKQHESNRGVKRNEGQI